MKVKYIYTMLISICTLSLGYAQCPDSVRVYVNPEVICPGEVAILSTDSTLLHCVNIGDIICVHNFTSDTAIVSPSDWTDLGLASSYNPLSVVFYVDSTCQHGWAVGTIFTEQRWYSRAGFEENLSLINDTRQSLKDLNGLTNTLTVKSGDNYTLYQSSYEVYNSVSNPFYIPAIGQLNILFSVKTIISNVPIVYQNPNLFSSSRWWSSTQFSDKNAWILETSGELNNVTKRTQATVIPVMNF